MCLQTERPEQFPTLVQSTLPHSQMILLHRAAGSSPLYNLWLYPDFMTNTAAAAAATVAATAAAVAAAD